MTTPDIRTSLAITPATFWSTWQQDHRQVFLSAMRDRFPDYGMLHLVLTQAEWGALPGNMLQGVIRQMPNPQPPGVLAGNATNAAVAIHKAEEELCNSYRRLAADLRTALINSLGPTLQERFSNALVAGTITMTSLEIVQAVQVLYGVRTTVDLKAIQDSMKVPLTSPDMDTFQPFCQSLRKNIRTFAEAGHPISQFDQLELFENLIKDHEQPLKAYRLYVEANPVLAARNLANAIAAVEIHLSNVTIATAGYAGSTSVNGPVPPPPSAGASTALFAGASTTLTPGDLSKIVDLLMAQLKSSSISAGSGGRTSTRRPAPGPTSPPLASNLYCYFHGYIGHDGASCKKMKAENLRAPGSFSNAKLRAQNPTAVPGGHP